MRGVFSPLDSTLCGLREGEVLAEKPEALPLYFFLCPASV